ncbi:hypothetical protein [Nonomuraea sp. NPDC050691]|uniref:hypothetical protein n=1 Tax=Nonomuraea sp. NPDC050691 TaxID=3155661 RepID=UPI0033D0BD90
MPLPIKRAVVAGGRLPSGLSLGTQILLAVVALVVIFVVLPHLGEPDASRVRPTGVVQA